MDPLNKKTIRTIDGVKTISVYACDILSFDEPIDIMTLSSFYRDYDPVQGTLFGALKSGNIDARKLASDPEIDLRQPGNIWLSREIDDTVLPIRRIGCIESSKTNWKEREKSLIISLQLYFKMLEMASLLGIKMNTIGLPVLGGGNQNMSVDILAIPVLNECIQFLKNNKEVKEIKIITRNQNQAFKFAMTLERSYSFYSETASHELEQDKPNGKMAFISYSSKDRNIADNLCAKLEARGCKVWYAPRNIVSNDYASAIVEAITRCSHFVLILSRNSVQSNHVLNEIDLAFRELQRGMKFLTLKVDEEELGPAFMYYLSRQHWMDAHIPPLEKRLEEFAGKV